jgi:uncharacterized protein with ParB-like and HNH nuclease domain
VRPIDGKAKSISELLQGKHYGIDYYQRQYKWGRKHVEDLVGDLTSAFREVYDESHDLGEVERYPGYFLGSVIMSNTDKGLFVVDGQQRLTTRTSHLMPQTSPSPTCWLDTATFSICSRRT